MMWKNIAQAGCAACLRMQQNDDVGGIHETVAVQVGSRFQGDRFKNLMQ